MAKSLPTEEVSGRNSLCRPQKKCKLGDSEHGDPYNTYTCVLKVRPESVRVLGYMASCALSTNHGVGKMKVIYVALSVGTALV